VNETDVRGRITNYAEQKKPADRSKEVSKGGTRKRKRKRPKTLLWIWVGRAKLISKTSVPTERKAAEKKIH